MDKLKTLKLKTVTVFDGSKTRAVIVKFENQIQRNEVFFRKKKLKSLRIVIVEDLTASRFELLNFVQDKLGRENVWSLRGRTFAKGGRKKGEPRI